MKGIQVADHLYISVFWDIVVIWVHGYDNDLDKFLFP